ncbi:hypothetical protein HK096_011319, partial [Nowakowskiella sp. JEL0078]
MEQTLADLHKKISDLEIDPENLESLDISSLLQQMDQTNNVLDMLESRTDALMEKLELFLDSSLDLSAEKAIDAIDNKSIHDKNSNEPVDD